MAWPINPEYYQEQMVIVFGVMWLWPILSLVVSGEVLKGTNQMGVNWWKSTQALCSEIVTLNCIPW